ncbi:hypothetical protein PV708_41450, partial [Streptomyces sp. ME02-6977A]|uniref:hypothetical protein n=1 Tax=Streptomyces sp. ME02-6977A TaxID=3028671 RepID=UPI0029B2D9B9
MAAVAAVAAVVVAQVVAELVEFGADLVDAGGRRGVLRRRGLVPAPFNHLTATPDLQGEILGGEVKIKKKKK